jgi:hypothetical protein
MEARDLEPCFKKCFTKLQHTFKINFDVMLKLNWFINSFVLKGAYHPFERKMPLNNFFKRFSLLFQKLSLPIARAIWDCCWWYLFGSVPRSWPTVPQRNLGPYVCRNGLQSHSFIWSAHFTVPHSFMSTFYSCCSHASIIEIQYETIFRTVFVYQRYKVQYQTYWKWTYDVIVA